MKKSKEQPQKHQPQQQEMEKDDVRQANEEGEPRDQGRTRGVPVNNYGGHPQTRRRDSDEPESGRHDAIE